MPAARSLLVLTLAAGCWRSRADERPLLFEHVEDRGFVMTAHGVGPFSARTRATEAGLQRAAPGMAIVPHDLGGKAGVVFDVLDGGERVFYVVPDDAPGWSQEDPGEHLYAETTFAVFAVSPRVTVDGRDWKVGAPFRDASGLDVCECWGDHEVTACFGIGTHVRVIFEQRCDEAAENGPRAMLGKPIARLMWKRQLEPKDNVDPSSDGR